jgi:5-methylcytosine-specific restriction endonuclease McrA
MAKEFSKSFYNSKEWQGCREGYIKSVFGLCEKCKKPGDILHHKIILTPDNIDNPDITLNWNNLEYLCIECHNKAHGRDYSITREDLMFDSNGMLIKRGER